MFLVLAALAVLVYLPVLAQPFIEDDYGNIVLARAYGPLSGWSEMFHDPIFRLRTTTWLMLYGINRLFGMRAPAYYTVMIALHMLNTGLVYSLGVWRSIGFRLSAWAAAFFAIYEGHQEAVMWISGSTEPLMLIFGLISFISWIRFLQRPGSLWYSMALISFCLALLSKESAVIFVPLLTLPILFDNLSWRSIWYLLPFGALAVIAASSIFLSRSFSFRFQDGSFSLHAPVWLIWPFNLARLFWIWGLLALIAILIWRYRGFGRILAIGLAWAALSLIPYSFLTYSLRIPSRQLHLASVGLSLIVGFSLLNLYDRFWPARRWVVIAVCALMLSENVAYLWTKKRSQFLARAAPTEQLIALARATNGPIYIRCFPREPLVAESALQLMAGRPATDLIWTADEARARHATATFCYSEH